MSEKAQENDTEASKSAHLHEYYITCVFALTATCVSLSSVHSTTAFPTHNCHRRSIKNSFPAMAKLCSRPLGFAAPFHRSDFFGTRLQNRLDRVAVDSACPPAGSINSACQIFSLLC